MSFTRMDQSSTADWMAIGGEVAKRQAGMPATIKAMLKQLADQVDGFAIDQLQHCLRRCRLGEGQLRSPASLSDRPLPRGARDVG